MQRRLFIGDSLAKAAGIGGKFGIPSYGLFNNRNCGSRSADGNLERDCRKTGTGKFRRQRSRLMDAMTDSHYQFGNKAVTWL
jgi:nitrogenase molybdenum-cofactor synthesis protein NifE